MVTIVWSITLGLSQLVSLFNVKRACVENGCLQPLTCRNLCYIVTFRLHFMSVS